MENDEGADNEIRWEATDAFLVVSAYSGGPWKASTRISFHNKRPSGPLEVDALPRGRPPMIRCAAMLERTPDPTTKAVQMFGSQPVQVLASKSSIKQSLQQIEGKRNPCLVPTTEACHFRNCPLDVPALGFSRLQPTCFVRLS